MLSYLLTLTLISLGANVFVASILQQLLQRRRVSFYDARGYFLLIGVFSTFMVASLAYFWGEMRFPHSPERLSEALVGVFYALGCNLVALLYGFVRLRQSLHI